MFFTYCTNVITAKSFVDKRLFFVQISLHSIKSILRNKKLLACNFQRTLSLTLMTFVLQLSSWGKYFAILDNMMSCTKYDTENLLCKTNLFIAMNHNI